LYPFRQKELLFLVKIGIKSADRLADVHEVSLKENRPDILRVICGAATYKDIVEKIVRAYQGARQCEIEELIAEEVY
jgi:hypothetical protein